MDGITLKCFTILSKPTIHGSTFVDQQIIAKTAVQQMSNSVIMPC